MTQIYTSYFSKIKEIKECFDRPYFISIARYINDDILKHIHGTIKEFIPSPNLLNDYKSGLINEEDYTKIYLDELSSNLFDLDIKLFFDSFNGQYDGIFLLCYEGKDKFCHRHILSKYLNENYRMNIVEWSKE